MRFLNKIKVALFILLSLSVIFFAVGCEKQADPETIYNTPKVDLDDYEYQPTYNVYGEVTLDGKLDDDVWKNQNKLQESFLVGGIEHNIEISTYFAQEGLVVYYKLTGSPVYFNQYRDSGNNSGLELYFANDTLDNIEQGAWEVSLDAGGQYTSKKYFKTAALEYAYHQYYAFIDRAICIDGELNSPDSNGFIMEIMFPWQFLTDDGKMADTISMDAAVIYCADRVGGRNAWVSTAKSCNPIYNWVNPLSWYRFSKFGFIESDAEPVSVINGGTGVENGSILIDGTFGGGFSVKAVPDAGYDIEVFKINGVSYDFSIVEFSPQQVYSLDIEISFKAIANASLRNISISAGYSGSVYTSFADGKAIALVNDTGTYTGIVENGVAKVYAPNGDFVVKTQDYGDVTITITENVADYDLKINKKLFSYNKNYIDIEDQGLNGASIVFDDVGINLPYNDSDMGTFNIDFNETVVLDHTLKIQTGYPLFTAFRFKDASGAYLPYFYNVGSWTGLNTVQIKRNENTLLSVNSSMVSQVTENGKTYLLLDFLYVIKDNNVTFYLKQNGVFKYVDNFTFDVPIGTMVLFVTDHQGELTYKNFKVVTGADVDKYLPANVVISQTGEANVSSTKQVIGLGMSTVITVTPKPASTGENIITKVTVNGNEVETFMDSGSKKFVLTHLDPGFTTYDVKIFTANVEHKTVEVNFSGKKVDGGTSNPAGKKATFTGFIDTDVTINAQGTTTINLVEGEYVVTVPGYLPANVVIGQNTTAVNVVLAEDIASGYENNFKLAYDEQNGYTFTSTEYWSRVYFNNKVPISDSLKISFTYNSTVASGVKHWVEFVFTSTAGQELKAQLLTWDTGFIFKNPIHTTESASIGNYNQKVSFNLYLIFKNGVLSLYNENNTCLGTVALPSDKNAQFGTLSNFYIHYAYDASYDWSITNFKVENYNG